MTKKKLFATAMLVALAAAPLALAHDGHNDTKDKTIPGPNPHCWPTQNPHDYGAPGSAEFDVVGRGGGGGVAGASDYNTEDCDNHDSTKQGPAHPDDADFDGDFEYGTGGGFFPAGFWANEPICQRGYVPHHDTNVHVHDAIWPPKTPLHNSVSFTVGADPSPPVVVAVPPILVVPPTVIDPDGNPDTEPNVVIPGITIGGGNECVDDGCICQGLDDPDDWLKTCLHKCPIFPPPPGKENNTSYGQPGGDGGFWVFVNCFAQTDGDVGVEGLPQPSVDPGLEDKNDDDIPDNADPSVDTGLVDENGDTVPDNPPPTVSFDPPQNAAGTCSSTGHIYFPNAWPNKNPDEEV